MTGQIETDLGISAPFIKGRNTPVRNCWHFCTDGNAVDYMFYEEADFVDGMNRIYVALMGYNVIILALCLMDTHVHFVLYGEYDECNRFVHDYLQRTSRYISLTHGDSNKLKDVPVTCQSVGDDYYLKTVICYVIKNPPVGSLQFNAYDYPWSSGALYFRKAGYWTSPPWLAEAGNAESTKGLGSHAIQDLLKTRKLTSGTIRMMGDLIYPGEYVDYQSVEKLFKTWKGFNYFMCITKEDDVESKGGAISRLSIPLQEMRVHKNELCMELFGVNSIKTLSTSQRVKLARTLRARYNSSLKQVVKLSGLIYDEVKDLI